MPVEISPGLKLLFFIHCLVALLLGIAYLVFPVAWGELVGWPAAQPFDHRVIGVTFFAAALASWLASKATEWAAVSILVQMNALFSVLAALLCLWGVVAGGLPALGWVYVLILAAFAVAFIGNYLRHARA